MRLLSEIPDANHGPHVLVEDIERPVLSDEDRDHLERSLRMRAGDPITIGDGAGSWVPGRFAELIEPIDQVRREPKPEPKLAVGFALIKGGRPELIVQKLTELGVDRIVPFRAGRSVVRWDDAKALKNVERLRRVAREAVMQCRRAWLPEVDPVADFAELASEPGASIADRSGSAVSLDSTLILVGPEGGWCAEELEAGLPSVRLAAPSLRAETAAIAAGSLLVAARDLN